MIVASIIVTTAHLSSDVTAKCLEAVERNTSLPYELFLIRDEPGHFGFSRENNRVMRIAEGKYLVLLNDDCFVHPKWLDRMVKKADSDERIGIVGAKLYGLDGKIQYEADKAGPDGDIDNIAFALVLIKRNVLDKIGFMNENYRFGSEDDEYCERAKQAGFRLVISDATATHLRNNSIDMSAMLLKTRGALFVKRSRGNSLLSTFPMMGYYLTIPLRQVVKRKAPAVYFALRRHSGWARRMLIGF
ncbi:MAG TPA: glycosyltransferase [Nitrososphaerales archaeon]|nr:glycosyltransferase [Nitrososphaerales archaeon]